MLYTAAGLVLLLLAAITATKIALDRVPAYRAQIQDWVRTQTGLHLRFSSVSPSLRWYGPELHFEDLELRSADDQRRIARARAGSVALDVWRLIANARLLAGRVRLDSPELVVTRLGPARFSIGEGLEFGQGHGDLRASLRSLPAGHLEIRDAHLVLLDWNDASPRLEFSGLDLEVGRAGDRIATEAALRMPRQLSGVLRLKFTVADFGGVDPVRWSASLRARDVSLPGWHDLLPGFSNAVQSGTARIDLSAAGRGEEEFQAGLELSARDFRAAGATRTLPEVGGTFNLARSGERWGFDGDRVRSGDPNAGGQTRFSANWRLRAGSLLALETKLDHLDLEALAPLVAVLPQKDLRDAINSKDASGTWSDARFSFDAAEGGKPARWQVRGRFSGAGIAPIGRAPGVKGVSGTLEGDERGGRLAIDAPGAIVSWPEQWPGPVIFQRFGATLFWQRDAQGLLVASRNIELTNQDLSAQAQLAVRRFEDGRAPEITLASVVRNVVASSAPRYLPRRNISPKAMEWLEHAFVGGHVPEARFVLRGPVRNFPFRDGSGLFLVRFAADDLALNYRDDWPRIENLGLQAEFRNQGLSVVLRHARAGDVEVQAGDARFPDFRTGELSVHAQSHTDAVSSLKFLSATPLDALAGNAFSRVDASGPLDATVDLFLPFKQFDQRRAQVRAVLLGVSLAYKGSRAVASQLRGNVRIDNAQVPEAQLRGEALGGPLYVRARAPRGREDLATQLELRGTFSAEALRSAFDIPAEVLPEGHAEWRGTVRLAPLPSRERWVRVSSNLAGLEIRLPAPLDKPAGESWPATAQVEWLKGPGALLHASVPGIGHGVLQWDAEGRVERSALQFGEAPATTSSQNRLAVGGEVKILDLSGWLALRDSLRGSPASPAHAGPALAELMQDASLSVGDLYFHALAFHDVQLALRVNGPDLAVHVEGPQTQGDLDLPADTGSRPWRLRFTRLKIDDRPGRATAQPPSEAQAGSPVSSVSPRNIPPLSFSAADLAWGSQKVGAVEATLVHADEGVALEALKVKSPSFSLEASGAWTGPEAGFGHLEGILVSNDVQQTLAQFGYADVIQGKAGRLEFDLKWAGMPSQAALASLNGRVKLEVTKGQIVDLHPGAGRVLGLASVATLPRRLFLDFSDITDKGLAFDAIRGEFELRNGDAYTSNLLLEGPAADIGLIGRVGLVKRDLDQTAAVAGNFSNSLPLASTLAAGPVAGAAVLVFTQVFKQPLKGLVRGYYRITGTWENPQIERVKGDAAAAATRRESQEVHK